MNKKSRSTIYFCVVSNDSAKKLLVDSTTQSEFFFYFFLPMHTKNKKMMKSIKNWTLLV